MNYCSHKCIVGIYCILLIFPIPLFAQVDPTDIQENIEQVSVKIEKLTKDIEQDQKEAQRLGAETKTLSSVVSDLERSERTLQNTIVSAEKKIKNTTLEIQQLNQEIQSLSQRNDINQQLIIRTLRELHKESGTGWWEMFFLFDTFSEFLEQSNFLSRTSELLRENFVELEKQQQDILIANNQKSLAASGLRVQVQDLDSRKQIVEYAKQEKKELLEQTKNQEQNFQTLLAKKRADLAVFEQQIQQLELELVVTVDESRVQEKLRGLFSWPFAGSYPITQFFGNTSYAAGGAYNGRGHSGVDFATPLGTPILAVMDGVVTAADDTGKHGAWVRGVYRRCISYGKWIVINHNNGLSTRVNHLSAISVVDGQAVRRGQVIGYSGNTGISTGPHLHISVAATQGFNITELGQVTTTTACHKARVPLAASNTYKDPFDYLPRPKLDLKPVRLGSRGADVRALQTMLKHERIFPAEIATNGIYGPTTARAVLEWQLEYNVGDKATIQQLQGKQFGADSVKKYGDLF